MAQFKVISNNGGKYVLFLSPIDYFGSDGYKTYVKDLKQVFLYLRKEKYSHMFVRVQCNRPKRTPNYYRVLIRPLEHGHRIIEASNNVLLTNRLFYNHCVI